MDKAVETSYNVLKYDPKRRDYVIEKLTIAELLSKQDTNFKPSTENGRLNKAQQSETKLGENKGMKYGAQSFYLISNYPSLMISHLSQDEDHAYNNSGDDSKVNVCLEDTQLMIQSNSAKEAKFGSEYCDTIMSLQK